MVVAGMEMRLKLDLGENMLVVDNEKEEDSGNENIGLVVIDASDIDISVFEMVAEIADIVKLEAEKRG